MLPKIATMHKGGKAIHWLAPCRRSFFSCSGGVGWMGMGGVRLGGAVWFGIGLGVLG